MEGFFTKFITDISASPLFYLISFVVIISAIMVVTLKNLFHCALYLVLCLFAVAGIYFLLGAEFLAAVQILIYVGAVSILMIFAIMLTSNIASKRALQSNEQVPVGFFISGILLFVCFGAITSSFWKVSDLPLPADNTMTIGKLLMTDFVLPFEVVSEILLAAMIGAIVLARKERS